MTKTTEMTKLRVSVIFVIFIIFLIFVINFVFSGRYILPQFFRLGPLTIRYYGMIMALAAASGFYLAIKRSAGYGINRATAEDLLFWIIIGGFIGARLYHVLSSFSYYRLHPIDIVKVWNGGLSIYGAVLGGLLALFIVRKLLATRYSLLALLNWLSPSLILGQIIGRFGNFFNYEAFGYPTNLPWKMFVPAQFRPEQYLSYNFFHPWFLYEALGNALILIFLFSYFSRTRDSQAKTGPPAFAEATAGKLFFSYLLLYNVLRLGLEFLRIDSTFVNGLRLNAVVSLVLAAVAGTAIILSNSLYDKTS